MKIISLKQRLRLIIIAFICIILFIVLVVVFPTTSGILNLQKEIRVTEVFLETQYQKSRRLSDKNQNFELLLESTASFDTFTISRESELSLIQTFEELAELHSIDQNLNVSYIDTPDEDVGLPFYEFSFLNHGIYEDHMQYLHALGMLPYIVDIDEIDMQGRSTDPNSYTNVSLRFSARIYAKEEK